MDTQRVAVFVDLENVPVGFIELVADLGDTCGRVCHLAVYADWRNANNRAAWATTLDLGGVPKQIMKAGGPNSADISIVVDAMELLLLVPDIDVFVLATGDSDFVPLIQRLRAHGKLVVGAVPAQKGVRSTYEAAFDRFERLREASSEPDVQAVPAVRGRAPATPSPGAAASPPKAPAALSLSTTRKALAGILSREGQLNCSEVGTQLRDAVPGFDHRALGFRRLSDLLRAQADLVRVVTDGAALLISLVPRPTTVPPPAAPPPPPSSAPSVAPLATAPEALAPPPVRVERIEWPRLRDHLLAVLLAPDAPAHAGDGDLRAAMDVLAHKTGGGELSPVPVGDVVAHYPSCFVRAEDGTIAPAVGLADAYRLRLNRLWEPVPRDTMRRGLALLPGILGDEPIALGDVTERLAANGELTQAQARAVVNLVRKAEGWTPEPPHDALGRPRFRPKPWLLDPASAEATIDAAAIARMGPFVPIDPSALSTALGADDATIDPPVSSTRASPEPEQMRLPL